ncbi:MAG: MATE family efflux transporter [Ruminococcaceae bacterium]|nr:MATE family efflux transporter [Oscillospiraceae bacterium]
MFTPKELKKLIIPLIIEQLLAISVGMFDTMMVSSLGDSAVSGVSLVDMLNVLMIYLFGALATGGAVVCAHEIGRVKAETPDGQTRDYRIARNAAKQLVMVLIIASISVAALAILLRKPLLKLCFGTIEDDVMRHALTYFVISAISYPFVALYNGFSALFRTMGNAKVTMEASVVVNLLNVAGNALLIFVFEMGVAGAAISSAVARLVGMIILLIKIANKKWDIHINFCEKFRPDLQTVKRILRIGIPSGFENSIFELGRILVISMVAGFGTVQVAANAVANNLDSFGCIPGKALALAMITVVGQCIGAGDIEAARLYERKLMKIAHISMLILNAIIILTLPLTLKLYNLSGETLKLAATLIIIHDGFACILWPQSFVRPNSLRAAQDVRFTMVVSIFSMCAFRIVGSWIIGVQLGLGIVGVWIAMLIDWVFRGSMFTWRWKTGKCFQYPHKSTSEVK